MNYRTLKGSTLLSPVPAVLVSAGNAAGQKNALAIAWAGTVCSHPPMVSVSIRPSRYSYDMICESGEFVINLCDERLLPVLDYCGVRSGRDEDKVQKTGISWMKADGMQFASAVDGAPVYLSCKVAQRIPLGSHDMFLAEVVSMGVRDDLFMPDGQIDLKKAHLIAYSHGVYQGLGEALGFFGYSVAALDVLERRMNALKE